MMNENRMRVSEILDGLQRFFRRRDRIPKNKPFEWLLIVAFRESLWWLGLEIKFSISLIEPREANRTCWEGSCKTSTQVIRNS
jgi:hypothetical protein